MTYGPEKDVQHLPKYQVGWPTKLILSMARMSHYFYIRSPTEQTTKNTFCFSDYSNPSNQDERDQPTKHT